ncbi:MAG: NADH-quinone oxidoreductase subunit J [Lachnospiraceae bacterium]|nr:NADH-quinone oxidoreductase subunit J [Lachnospiraceae bacterium]
MNITELSTLMRENGVVGAGGAGFPSYAKLNEKADTIILNCAECEPLLKLHRQVLEKYAYEIMSTLESIAEAVGASHVIIAIKGSYKEAVEAVKAQLASFSKTEIGYLPEIYPAGDEVITIYETTGRVVPPGSLPIEVGVIVYNVETIYNVYRAMASQAPVTYKYITIAGEVKKPVTLKAPLGITYYELVQLAGGATVEDPVFIGGGPMTGRIVNGYDTVTKTSNAVLVMPPNALIVQKKTSRIQIDMKRAMAACCQCQMCTDLCPRHLLGHPIEPHAFMRSASSGVTKDVAPYIGTMFCSQCGLCEMFSCFQSLSPRTLIGECKAGLRKNGVPIPKGIEAAPVNPNRESRLVSKERLTIRLGLAKYDVPAPLEDTLVTPDIVKIALTQHIGAPAVSTVSKGDMVTEGQVIGRVDEGKLGVNTHASIRGTVMEVNDRFVTIKAQK